MPRHPSHNLGSSRATVKRRTPCPHNWWSLHKISRNSTNNSVGLHQQPQQQLQHLPQHQQQCPPANVGLAPPALKPQPDPVQDQILKTLKVLQQSILQLRADVDDMQLNQPEQEEESDAEGGGEALDLLGPEDAGMSGIQKKRRGRLLEPPGKKPNADGA